MFMRVTVRDRVMVRAIFRVRHRGQESSHTQLQYCCAQTHACATLMSCEGAGLCVRCVLPGWPWHVPPGCLLRLDSHPALHLLQIRSPPTSMTREHGARRWTAWSKAMGLLPSCTRLLGNIRDCAMCDRAMRCAICAISRPCKISHDWHRSLRYRYPWPRRCREADGPQFNSHNTQCCITRRAL